MRTPRCILIFAGSLCGWQSASAAILLADSSLNWTAMPGNYDYFNDHQTGRRAGDIVGSASDPGFFTRFIVGSQESNTDGHLAFRVRLDAPGGTPGAPAFDRFLWVGIDATLNGALDVFVGVNRQGNNDLLEIYAPGTGFNTSPSTTSIMRNPYYSVPLSSTTYDFRPVDIGFDGGASNDLGLNEPDYYVSFAMPLQEIVNFLATVGIAMNDSTPVRYVLATSNQANSLNQDLGGINGGINSSVSWEELGGFSPVSSVAGGPIPEPRSAMLVPAGGILAALRRRRFR